MYLNLTKLAYGDDPLDPNIGAFNTGTVAIDTETTGLGWQDEVIMLSLAWRDPEQTLRSCCLVTENNLADWDALGLSVPAIDDLGGVLNAIFGQSKVVFHNLPFDFRMLWHWIGVAPADNMHDTMHLAKQVGWFDSLSLASLYRQLVGECPPWVEDVKEHRKTFMRIPLELRAKYSDWDARATLEVYEALRGLAVGTINPSLYRRDLQFTKLVMTMITRGVAVDTEFAAAQEQKFSLRVAELADKYAQVGIKNLNSADQVRAYLFGPLGITSDHLPKTATGRVSIGAEVLDTLINAYPDIEGLSEIVEYRQLFKCVNDWLLEFPALATDTGSVHSELHPFGTRSFRMTAKEPNMLALPMEDRGRAFGSLLGLFKAPSPFQYWALDLKQAEVRLGAMLAQESGLAAAFQGGADPYSEMAVTIWREVNKELRRRAKAAMLAGLYEIGPRTFSQKHKLSEAESRKILEDFRARFPNIKAASRFYSEWAEKNGYVPFHDGRRRYFAKDDDFYKAFNQRVQGGVAEIMQTIMLEVENRYPGRLVLQIHDAVVLKAEEDEEPRNQMFAGVQEIVDACVPQELYEMTTPRIPFIAEAKAWQ